MTDNSLEEIVGNPILERIATALEKIAVYLEKEKTTLKETEPKYTEHIKESKDSEKYYSISEFAKKIGKAACTVSCMVHGHAGYNNHFLSKVAEKVNAGKTAKFMIPASALEYFNIKNNENGLEKKFSYSEKIPKAQLKKELIEKGISYIENYFNKHNRIPPLNSKSLETKYEDIKRAGWKTFKNYYKSLMISEKGVNLRKKIEKYFAEKGYNGRKIAKKLKLASSSVVYDLHEQGILTAENIKRHYNSLEKIKYKKILDYKNYDKDGIREAMLIEAGKRIPDRKINYLGLEGPHFGSYITLGKKINPEKSVVVEKDNRAYNTLECIIRNHNKINGGKIFKKLNLYKGDIYDISKILIDYKFNFINLDYNGPLDYKKLETIDNLFEKGNIANECVLFITLNEHPRKIQQSESALKEEFGTSDYIETTSTHLVKTAKMHGYEIEPIFGQRYQSGKIPMIIMGYKFKK